MDTSNSITTHPTALTEAFESWGLGTATVYLPTPSDEADAQERFSIRSRNALRALEETGASAATVATVESALGAHGHDDGEGLVIVARDDELVVDHVTRHPIDREHVFTGALPQLLPVLAASQNDLPHLAVLLDRTGADLFLRTGPGTDVTPTESEGDDPRVHRSHPGGWSQRRFQQIAENAWENNAKDVVDDILSSYGDVADLVVGGDERAVGFFEQHLPERLRPVLRVDGSRHSDHDAFLDAADTAIDDLAARQMTDALRDVKEAVGNGSGVAGTEVLDLLSQGRVRRLVVGDDTFAADRPTSHFDFEAGFHAGGQAPDGASTESAASTDAAMFLALRLGVETVVVPPAALTTDPPLAAVVHA